MNRMCKLGPAALLGGTLAVTAAELPPGGTAVLAQHANAVEWAGSKSDRGSVEVTNGVWRATSVVRTNPWDVEFGWTVPDAWTANDVAVVRFRARTIACDDETGEGQVVVFLQTNGAPYDKQLSQSVSLPRAEWKTIVLAARVRKGYPAKGSALRLNLGMTRQTLEIADVELWRYPPTTDLKTLPTVRSTYAGRESDAAWRAEADARIERLRKADVTVRVVDANGKPVAGADVRLEMRRHAFPFGSAYPAARLVGTAPDDLAYQRKVSELFNAGTFENDLKWPPWEGGDAHRERVRQALAWCAARGIAIRGHVMVWPSFRHLPKRLAGTKDPQVVKDAVLAHIDELAAATAADVREWDVVNEPFDNHDLMDLCGPDVMTEWYRRARLRLPDAKLYLNDYGILTTTHPDAHQDFMFATAKTLLAQGAPLDGLGFQGHFGNNPPPIASIWRTLERFAVLGRTIRITEFDISTQDEQLQADFQRDLMTLCFSHPSIVGFQFWGFWEGSHWKPECAMYARDWTERPNGAAYRALVFDRWWSRGTAHSDAQGQATFRVFKGRHAVTATSGGVTRELELDIGDGGAEVVLKLEP